MTALRRGLVALALLVTAAAPAAADTPRESFAHFFDVAVDDVSDLAGFELKGVPAYTNVLVARYRKEGRSLVGAVLLRCGAKQCLGTRVWLGAADVQIRGLVDLDGKAGPIAPAGHIDGREAWNGTLPGPTGRMRWPVLVVESIDDQKTTGETRFRGKVSGMERHHHLQLISLRKAEQPTPRFVSLPTMDLYPSGAGSTTGYRLERGKARGALDIVATEQREIESDSRCLRPKPVEYRLIWKDGRFEQVGDPRRTGC